MSGELFSVYWEDPSGRVHREVAHVGRDEAARAWQRLTRGPAAQLGLVKGVKLTDSLDRLVHEWEKS